jgi:DNA-directed RNA polymerase specialized sigma24 family protein
MSQNQGFERPTIAAEATWTSGYNRGMTRDGSQPASAAGERRFVTTQWSLVVAASDRGRPEADGALSTLCERYWYPVYAFVRRRGNLAADAQDITQEFFTTLLEKGFLRSADRERGRFRTFLLTAVSRFLAKQAERGMAQKRGGGRKLLSIDLADAEGRYLLEPADRCTPEALFERRWAIELLDRAFLRLGADYASKGKTVLFEALRPHLVAGDNVTDYSDLAAKMKMTTGALKVALHRLRRRFAQTLKEEIAATVVAPDEVEDEIDRLLAAVRP